MKFEINLRILVKANESINSIVWDGKPKARCELQTDVLAHIAEAELNNFFLQ
jgi:hypothetical protein